MRALQAIRLTEISRRVHSGNGDDGDTPRRPEPFIVRDGIGKTKLPKRVLVVEDNLDSVHTLALLLSDMGHKVEYAINGYVAINVARRFRPDFVLLDLGLPGIDGFEVCRQIKRDPELRSCRVIALTAFSQDEYRARAKNAGCELYLVKPVDTRVLEDLLG
jgi:two-component system CheB/CheR fusion protein